MELEDAMLYNSIGIYIDETTTKLTTLNVFMSVFFDVMEFLLTMLITITYSSHKKDVLLVYS